MSDSALFTQDFKPEPYWWETATPVSHADAELPGDADIAIVGAGYTGLHAAIQTARAGKATVVLDAEAAGWGCSTRNGGQISTCIKPTYSALKRRYGEALATDILREGQASLDYIADFVRDEKLDCGFNIAGRFHGAHTPGQYEKLARACDDRNPAFETGAYMVPRGEQHRELGTDAYHGGMILPKHACIDVGLYFDGIRKVAESAGASIVSHCPATEIERLEHGGFRITTPKGRLRAGRIILATNGYTGPLTPWHQRRVIPIGSYVIATEPIDGDVMNRIMPTDRILSDTRKLVYYYRPSPDRTRIVFGGRVSLRETDPLVSGPKLRTELVRLFPELKDIRISHSWAGFVAFTFDTLMHTGNDNGLYYAMGYCGSGVGMASYLGMRIGRQAAGLDDSAGAFDLVPFKSRPFYSGTPWFLAPSIVVYRIRDRLGI